MVGAVRFELTTSWTRTKRASQTTLRPDIELCSLPAVLEKCNAEIRRLPAGKTQRYFSAIPTNGGIGQSSVSEMARSSSASAS